MGKTQIRGEEVGDGTVCREDLNVTTSGRSVIRKIIETARSGIKILSSSGIDAGTGDVSLKVDTDIFAPVDNGTTFGQMLYWNGSKWIASSAGKLKYDETGGVATLNLGKVTIDGVDYQIFVDGTTIGAQFYGITSLRSAFSRNSGALNLARPDFHGIEGSKGFQCLLGRSTLLTDVILGDGTNANNPYVRLPNYGAGNLKTDANGLIIADDTPDDVYADWKIKGDNLGSSLYNWYAITDARGICPAGYHVPTDAEWSTLTTNLGGESVAGSALKITGQFRWGQNIGATNSSGFSAKGMGIRYDTGVFGGINAVTEFWTASSSGGYGYFRRLSALYTDVYRNIISYNEGCSVRLIKNDSTDPGTAEDYDGNVYDTVKIGDQVWMKQNLRVKHFNNGDAIPNVTDNAAWAALSTAGMCYYDNVNSLPVLEVPIHSHDVVSFQDSNTLKWEIERISDTEVRLVAIVSGMSGYLTAITKAMVEAVLTGAITSHTHSYQPADADLTSIAALAGSAGILKKTAADTWVLDTSVYLTAITKVMVEAVLTGAITSHTHNYEPVISTKKAAFNVDFGAEAGKACEGNDPKLSDNRVPTDNSVSYVKQHSEFKGDLTITSNAIDWATGFYKAITLTANTTYTFTNLEKGKTICLKMTGSFTPTFPASVTIVNGGAYDGTKQNYILLSCIDSTTPAVFATINKP